MNPPTSRPGLSLETLMPRHDPPLRGGNIRRRCSERAAGVPPTTQRVPSLQCLPVKSSRSAACRPLPEPYRIRHAIFQWWAENRKRKTSHRSRIQEPDICESSIRIAVEVAVALLTSPFFANPILGSSPMRHVGNGAEIFSPLHIPCLAHVHSRAKPLPESDPGLSVVCLPFVVPLLSPSQLPPPQPKVFCPAGECHRKVAGEGGLRGWQNRILQTAALFMFKVAAL